MDYSSDDLEIIDGPAAAGSSFVEDDTRVAPAVQAERDRVRRQMLEGERQALAARGETNADLEREIQLADAGIDFTGRRKPSAESADPEAVRKMRDFGLREMNRATQAAVQPKAGYSSDELEILEPAKKEKPEEATLTTSMERGIGQAFQAGNATILGANQRSIDVMDRIDRGEAVRDVDDPLGYQYMDAAARRAIREKTQASLAQNVADIARHVQTTETLPRHAPTEKLTSAKTFGDAWDAFTADPVGVVAHLGAESLPNMAPGLAAAAMTGGVGKVGMLLRGVKGAVPAAPGAAAMGAGSYGTEYASGILQSLQEMGIDLRNESQLRAAVSDPELMRQVRDKAAAKAAVVGALDAASGGVAAKTLIPEHAARRGMRDAAELALQAPAQGALGAAGEAGGAVAAGDQVQPGAVAAEFFGEFVGAPAEMASMAASRAADARARPETRQPAGEAAPGGAPVDAGEVLGTPEPPAPPAGAAPAEEAIRPVSAMQPRDRDRAASVAQMQSIANDPDFDRLAAAPTPTDGAPLVSSKADAPAAALVGREDIVTFEGGMKVPVHYAVVEAGSVLASNTADGRVVPEYFADHDPGTLRALTNGRTAGVQAAYDRGTAGTYREKLLAAAPALGLDPAQVGAFERPMLIRLYSDRVNEEVPNLGELSNAGGGMRLGPVEQARADALKIQSLAGLQVNEEGVFDQKGSAGFVRQFLATVPPNDLNQLVDSSGALSSVGLARLRNAIFAKAFGAGPVLDRVLESNDSNVRTVTNGMLKAAPLVADMRARMAAGTLDASLDVTEDFVGAVEQFSKLRAEGSSVAEYLAQGDMLGRPFSPDTIDLMSQIEGMSRSAKRVAEFLANYVQEVERAGNPGQGSLIDAARLDRGEILKKINPQPDRAEIEADHAARAVAAAADMRSAVSQAAALTKDTGVQHRARRVGDQWVVVPEQSNKEEAPNEPRQPPLAGTSAPAEGSAVVRAEARSEPEAAVPGAQRTRPEEEVAPTVDAAAHEAATSPENDRPEPTEAQKEAGNYKKGHALVAGFDLSIENPAGSKRRPEWPTLKSHYGYFKGTVGRDKDHVDVFVKEGTPADFAGQVYVVDQEVDGKFDEHKVMLGFDSVEEARAAYLENYTKGWKGLAAITPMTLEQFREWVFNPEMTRKRAATNVRAAKPAPAQENATRLAPEQAAKLDSMYEEAAARKPAFDALVSDIAQGANAKAKLAPIKGRPRAEAKIVSDYKGDASRIKDLLRATIVADTLADARAAIEALRSRMKLLPAGQRDLLAADAKPGPDGYRDAKFNVAIDGHVAEIQVSLAPLVEAKKTAHPIYAEREALKRKIDDENREETKEEAAAIAELNRRQREIYEPVWAEIMSRNAASEMGAPLRSAEPESNLRGGDSSQAAQKNPETPSPMETGIPSTSKNVAPGRKRSTETLDIGGPPTAPIVPKTEPSSEGDKGYGANNKIVTKDAAEAARELLRKNLGRLNSGLDPELAAAALKLATFHIEAGARSFAAFSKAMVEDIGEAIKPYLKSLYDQVRSSQGDLFGGMDGPGTTALLEQTKVKPAADAKARGARAKKVIAQVAQGGFDFDAPAPQNEVAGGAENEPKPREGHDRAQDEGRSPGAVRAPEGGRNAANDARGPGERHREPGGARDAQGGQRSEPARPEGDGAAASDGGRRPADAGDSSLRTRISRGRTDNYRFGDEDLTATGGAVTRARYNVQAVELLKRLEAEGRQATPEEQKTLARFIGWGWGEIRNNIFPAQTWQRPSGAWRELRDRLDAAMSPEEIEAAQRSTQYAHYTSKEVVRSMWRAMERMGFAGGQVLEPGMGIGNFPGLMPEPIAQSSIYTGIEFDPITGGIAKQLFPAENIKVESYVDTQLPRDFFDAAIGNPPFAPTTILADSEYRKQAFKLHDYFFAKTIDRVRPGGLLAFVTSRYTMDKANDKARAYLAERANLLGAIRLPQTAFKANAGTEVVTDVIFLQKRGPGIEDNGVKWAGLAEVKTPDGVAHVNEYFAAHPEMVLGKHSLKGTMYAKGEYTVLPLDTPIEADFSRAVEKLPENVYRAEPGSKAGLAQAIAHDFNPKATKEGSYYVDDAGVIRIRDEGVGKAVKDVLGRELSKKEAGLVRDYVVLRDSLKQALYDQLTDSRDWEKSHKALQREYRRFVERNGRLAQFRIQERTEKYLDEEGNEQSQPVEKVIFTLDRVFRMDPEWTNVAALESFNEDTRAITESDFLKMRVLNKPTEPKVETPQDALMVTLAERGRVDVAVAAARVGMSQRAFVDSLGDALYEDPSTGWTTADDYLSGDVKKKLRLAQEAAKTNAKFKRNVEALANLQPRSIPPSEITVQMGANWVPAQVYMDFAKETAGVTLQIQRNEATGEWNVERVAGYGTATATTEWGTPRRPFHNLVDAALNKREVKVFDRDSEGKEHLNAVETEAAQEKLRKIKAAFQSFAWSDPKRTDELVGIYNRKFNRLVHREFDGSHLTLPGVTLKFKPHPHVKRAVWRIIQQGNVYLAHAVGAGKTAEMVIGGMEEKRLGLVKKPMYVVPNHMLKQFAAEFQEIYPAAKIMVADEHQFHADNRRRFVSRVALSDLDAVVITQSAFKILGLDPDFQRKMIERELDLLRELLGEMDKSERVKRRQMEQMIEKLEQRLEKAMRAGRKDTNVRFDELGVDKLYVDEAHLYRKLSFGTNMGALKGIDPAGSDYAWDLYTKVRWLEEKKNPGRSLVMASGTPIVNTLAELFSVQRFMNPAALEERGVERFDDWASMFGSEKTTTEADAAGGYKPVTRFSQFVNAGELGQMFREFADVITTEKLGSLLVNRPKLKGGGRELIVTPRTPELARYQRALKKRMEAIRNRRGPPKPGDDILLSVITDGRIAALDMRYHNNMLPSNPDSKLNRVIREVAQVYKDTADWEYLSRDGKVEPNKGAAQMVFSDVGFGAGVMARGFNAREWFVNELVRQGVKREHIAFMADYKKSDAKLKLFRDMNTGRVRILVGSSVNMGTGVNAQQRLWAMHHLDAPWYPADLQQRQGRGLRHGNKNKEFWERAYATKGTYDQVMWQMLATKQQFIDQMLQGNRDLNVIDDVTEADQYTMAVAMTAGDERAILLAGLKADISKLERLYQSHIDNQQRMRSGISVARHNIEVAGRGIKPATEQAKKIRDLSGDKFTMRVGKTDFTSRAEAGRALNDAFKHYVTALKQDREVVGEISGFPIYMVGEQLKNAAGKVVNYSAAVRLEREPHSVSIMAELGLDPVGVAMRLQNSIDTMRSLPRELEQKKAEAEATLADLESRVNKPFEFHQMLADKKAEAAELERQLAEEAPAEDEDAADDEDWPDEGKARRGAAPRMVGMRRRDVQAIAARVQARRPINVVATPGELPVPAAADTKGMYVNGQVWLVSDNLIDAWDAEATIEHELTHNGIDLRFPSDSVREVALKNLMAVNPRLRELASAWRVQYGEAFIGKRVGAGQSREAAQRALVLESMEEAVAYFAQRRIPFTGLKNLIAQIAKTLRARGFKALPDWLERATDAEALAFIAEARAAATESAAVHSIGTRTEPAFMGARLDVRALLRAQMKRAELAARAASSVTDSEAFKTWFGKSKVVDAQGKPRVVYHGTDADFSEFLHTNDIGFHFGTLPQAEARLMTEERGKWDEGGNVMPVYLKIEKPLRMDDLHMWEPDDVLAALERQGLIEAPENSTLVDREFVRDSLAKKGYDGIVYHNETEGSGDSYIVFEPDQVKSAIGNRGTFAVREPDVRFARAGFTPPAREPRVGLLDAILRAAGGKWLAAHVTDPLWERTTTLAARFIPERVKQGVVSDYGLPEPYLDARVDREARIGQLLRRSKSLLDRIQGLDRAQSRVAYLWMTGQPNLDTETELMAGLPEEARVALRAMKQEVADMGREARDLGLLSEEVYQRNNLAYLHRTYLKYEREAAGAKATRRRSASIRGEQFRGRGLRDDATMDALSKVDPEWWGLSVREGQADTSLKGKKFLRLERRGPAPGVAPLEGFESITPTGKLLEVVYWPTERGEPPEKFRAWRRDGEWEARYFDHKGKVGMWRDFTAEERARMGEIDEVRYAFARTMLAMVRDVETARFLKWTSGEYSVPTEGQVTRRGGKVVAPKDVRTTLQTFGADDWVKVPDTKAQGTAIPKYGALAGRYVPGTIWNDIRQTVNVRSEGELGQLWDAMLTAWKISKTALSPAVHTNNVMSNFILADMADVRGRDIVRSLATIARAQAGKADAKALLERYQDSGAELGAFAQVELKTEILEPLLKSFEEEEARMASEVGALARAAQIMSLALHGKFREAGAELRLSSTGRLATAPIKKLIEVYGHEDRIFRLAKFLKEVEEGASDREAGKAARLSFLDYHINAPWIQAARRSALPFIAFSYRAIPLVVQAAAKKPWKLAKYALLAGGLNALSYAMLGMGDDDEDRERKLLPEEFQGNIFGIFPRLMRMPWNDEGGAPVFLDVRRWIPVGDVMDTTGSHSAVPLPSWLSLGGPLAMLMEVFSNRAMFTGRPIVYESDTLAEKVAKLADHQFKFWAPNVPVPNPFGYIGDLAFPDSPVRTGFLQTYATTNVTKALTEQTDAFGRTQDLAESALSSVGVKARAYPADQMRQAATRRAEAQIREIDQVIGDLRRQRAMKGLTEEQFVRKVTAQAEKKREIRQRLEQRLGGPAPAE